jgi:hypothetical protein
LKRAAKVAGMAAQIGKPTRFHSTQCAIGEQVRQGIKLTTHFQKTKECPDHDAGKGKTYDSDWMRTYAASLALSESSRFGTNFDHKVRSYHTFE